MTVWIPDDKGGHEYDRENPDDGHRLLAFMSKMSHYVDSDGVLWVNTDYSEEEDE